MAQIVTWPGPNGHSYNFELYPIGASFHPFGGVYIFCKPSPNGQWDPIYVGETSNFDERLNTRLQHHQAWPASRLHGATHVCVRIVSGMHSESVRRNLETKLRHSLNPPVNRQ